MIFYGTSPGVLPEWPAPEAVRCPGLASAVGWSWCVSRASFGAPSAPVFGLSTSGPDFHLW